MVQANRAKDIMNPFLERLNLLRYEIGAKDIHEERERRMEEERRERVRKEAEADRIRRLNFSRVPKRYQGLDFSSFAYASEQHKSMIARFAAYSGQEVSEAMKNLIIHGGLGTGKTRLLCVMAQSRNDTQYWRFSDIIRRVKDTFSSAATETESIVLGELSRVGVLIIDEIGRQYDSKLENNFIFDLIDNRYNNCLPTVLCSNLPVDGNPSITAYIGPAAMDRINENSAVAEFNWHNFRSWCGSELNAGRNNQN